MAVWNLTPGEEHPAPQKRKIGTAVAGSLSPQEVADRAESLGARVVFKDCKYRVYPADPKQGPMFFSDKFGDNRTRSNTISSLRRAGIDITAEPEQETSPMTAPTATAVNGKPTAIPPKPWTPTLAKLEQQFKDLLELVTENDTDRDRELTELRDRVASLEERLAATPGAPPAKDPDADLDESILTFMRSAPIKLTAPAIHANLILDVDVPVVKVGKRLQALADSGKVVATGEPSGGNCIYHLPAKSQGSKS
jgi:hypothetical protein